MPSRYRLTESPADDLHRFASAYGVATSVRSTTATPTAAAQATAAPTTSNTRSRSLKGLTSEGRERGLCKLMATNLLKRIESSVSAFRLTLGRIRDAMADQVDAIDAFRDALEAPSPFTDPGMHEVQPLARSRAIDWDAFDLDLDDSEEAEETAQSQTATLPAILPADAVDLNNLDLISWRRDILQDIDTKEQIINKTFLAMMENLGYDVQLTYKKRDTKKDVKQGRQNGR
ncbi:hypothetical protein [Bifidobacterium boum]|uniref:hypothetical protein n=1 Tax=Bifidobacterium boum TaxID=78343 RepID=UPI003F90FC05